MKTMEVLLVEDSLGDALLAGQILAESQVPVRLHIARDGKQALAILADPVFEPALIILDLGIPMISGEEVLKRNQRKNIPVAVFSATRNEAEVQRALSLGARDYIQKPTDLPAYRDAVIGMVNQTRSKLESTSAQAPSPSVVASAATLATSSNRISTHSALKWNEELELIVNRVSQFDVPVLIRGETGVGKEVVARMLHARSGRMGKPFLKLNCAALPSELVESELFGYERGAFTGALKLTPGKFKLADGGTIFLDEIGDMNVHLQAKLLQVLQDQEYLPLGAREPVHVDVRVIAATHRDLEESMLRGEFREDLYYRLEVFTIKVPPLRERKESILDLAHFFLQKYANSGTRTPEFTPQLQQALSNYTWPGNVRELENLMRRFLIDRDPRSLEDELARRIGTFVRKSTVERTSGPMLVASKPNLPSPPAFHQSRDKHEAEMILSALNSTKWNCKLAAGKLQMNYKSLLYRMKRLGIGSARKENAAFLSKADSAD